MNKDFIFTASQVQHYAWLAKREPSAFERLRCAIAGGRFVPVGGAWVEPDANIPTGESFIRQLLHGVQWTRTHMQDAIAAGVRAQCAAAGVPPPARVPFGDGVFFLPDTFGYSSQIPQICRSAGLRYFLTQKLSWSLLNKVRACVCVCVSRFHRKRRARTL